MLMLLEEICRNPDEKYVYTVWAIEDVFHFKTEDLRLHGLLKS
jgi:hypothetical protein